MPSGSSLTSLHRTFSFMKLVCKWTSTSVTEIVSFVIPLRSLVSPVSVKSVLPGVPFIARCALHLYHEVSECFCDNHLV